MSGTGGLSSLPLAARTQVLAVLRDKDERIYEQSRDIERLHERVALLTSKLDGTRRQLHTLDKVGLFLFLQRSPADKIACKIVLH